MKMKKTLLKQIEFDRWANVELLASMRKADKMDERVLFLFAHLLNASAMWLNRVKGEELSTALFQERSLDDCEQLIEANTQGWKAYIDKHNQEEFDRIVEFVFPVDGTHKRISVQDAILHIVNHASYHRGQIVSRLKGTVEPLPLITYIVYATANL
jgi:uncharacterized damage-inducible protein DinB